MSDRIAIMNEGRIVQLGTPREIYTRPATVFASDFIGQTNLLRGTVRATDRQVVTLEVGAGQLVAAESASALSPGGAATLSVRPEAIRVARDGAAPPGPHGLSGTIAEIVYLGSSVRIALGVAGDLVIWADLRDEEAGGLEIGTKVRATWTPSAATIWAGEGK